MNANMQALLKTMGMIGVDELLAFLGHQINTTNSKHSTIHALRKRGLPQSRKYSGRVYWKKEEIENWVKAQVQ